MLIPNCSAAFNCSVMRICSAECLNTRTSTSNTRHHRAFKCRETHSDKAPGTINSPKLVVTSIQRFWTSSTQLQPGLVRDINDHLPALEHGPPQALVVDCECPHDSNDRHALDAHQLALIVLRAGSPSKEGGHILQQGEERMP